MPFLSLFYSFNLKKFARPHNQILNFGLAEIESGDFFINY